MTRLRESNQQAAEYADARLVSLLKLNENMTPIIDSDSGKPLNEVIQTYFLI